MMLHEINNLNLNLIRLGCVQNSEHNEWITIMFHTYIKAYYLIFLNTKSFFRENIDIRFDKL